MDESRSRVLIVEDEASLVTLLQYNLGKEGFDVTAATDGEEGLRLAQASPPHLILLDWMLPGMAGDEVCRRLRANPRTASVPIIMLTARGEERDKVRGLDAGADDYVTKPFSPAELTARVRAVLRRVSPPSGLLTGGDIEMDLTAVKVRRAGQDIHLGPTEFRLLKHLMQHPGRVFSREQLLDTVWGQDINVEIRTVDVHIRRLRKALNGETLPDVIRTVRSAGYSFDLSGGAEA